MKKIYNYFDKTPKIPNSSFIAPGARVIGDVLIGEKVGIWFNVVVRGDVAPIRIGNRTNIQDGTIIHVTRNGHPTIIGSNVTVGHKVMLHACTLEDHSFVGMGSIILDDAKVESYGMLAAGALLTSKKIVKKGELWAGNPAKFMRNLTDKEMEFIDISANNYVKHVEEYLEISRAW
jgi:carbonic anhydrase/acetyltransferase-like protein (isoleucine patch superfamily)